MTVTITKSELANRSQLDWKQYPLKISESEKKTFDFSRIEKILQNALKSPLEQAEIPYSEACLTLTHIDKSFREAIKNYKNQLDAATDSDDQGIQLLNKRCKWIPWACSLLGGIVLPFGITPLVIGGGVVIGAAGYAGGKKYDANLIVYEGSDYRRAWCHEIYALEKKRIKDIENRIILRCEELISSLKPLNAAGETSLKSIRELKQLQTVYSSIFPEKPLEVEGESLSKYLVQIKD